MSSRSVQQSREQRTPVPPRLGCTRSSNVGEVAASIRRTVTSCYFWTSRSESAILQRYKISSVFLVITNVTIFTLGNSTIYF